MGLSPRSVARPSCTLSLVSLASHPSQPAARTAVTTTQALIPRPAPPTPLRRPSPLRREQIILAERALLRTLSFDVYLPTASSFLSANIDAAEQEISRSSRRAFKFGKALHDVACLLVDLALLSHNALACQPSLIAAAAVSVALERTGEKADCWASGKLSRFTGYSLADLEPARRLVAGLARDAFEMRRQYDREPKRSRANSNTVLNLAINASVSPEVMQMAALGVRG